VSDFREARLRIGIDARLLDAPASGIGRYTRALVDALLGLAPHEDWRLYVDRAGAVAPAGARVRTVPWPQRLLWTLWAAPRALAREGLDVYHGVTGFELPRVAGVKLVTTVHDLIPLRFPALVPRRHRWAFRGLLPGALRRAHRVIAVSETTRQELLARYRVAPDKIRVIHEAPAPGFHPMSAAVREAVRIRHRLRRPFVLFVGLLEPKKNPGALLGAAARLRAAGAWGETDLVIVGAPGWGPGSWAAEARRLGLDGLTRFLGPVPDDELAALYGEAHAFVFPSLWEGFGLPVLEAMACGAPVVASRRGAIPEVAGEAALLVEPEALAVAEALGQVLGDAGLRERLRAAGLARAASFSWERTAAATLAVYRGAAA
jgi:glycosyltransferase involved in cell wall biosynthesis